MSEQVYQPDFLPDKFESGTPNYPWDRRTGEQGLTFIRKTGIENVQEARTGV
ncbi:hypothetical protein [Syntrophaceticus schinkii]|uniref:hypothetical protein n=1 Tax=Syntrophaceticus schinkii TaxID=499207 RepID=UPI0018DCB297|nr:hypothetical protein [Syntrophaceticus schinkii]